MGEYLFLGGDGRMQYAAQRLAQSNAVCAIGLGEILPPPQGRCSKIVLPLPFSRDNESINAPLSREPLPLSLITEYADKGAAVLSGGTSEALLTLCTDNGLMLRDYFAAEGLTLKNALLTAEGAIALLIGCTDMSLFGSAALIIGYGRIAGYTARLLKAFGCRVTVAARDPVQRERAVLDGLCSLPMCLAESAAADSDYIINTAPAHILTGRAFAAMKSRAVYMELATMPARPEEEWAQTAGVKYIRAAGLPGRFSARAAGEAVAEAISAAAETFDR